jgi:dTDP-4-dehydrorhamnose 3,5-epimerase-like enzyme
LTQFPVQGCKILTPPVHSDERGSLVALERSTGVRFEIRRAFYIFDTPEGAGRGAHAHREVEQLLVCVAGACTVSVDNGSERAEVRLDNPAKTLAIGPMIWNEMRDFSRGAVLLVLASGHYDESEYVRDYERFRELVNG